MVKSLNLEIWEFKQGIVQCINSSALPLEVKRMTLNEVISAVSRANEIQINQERLKLQKAQEGGTEDGKEIRKAELAEQSVDSDTSKCDKS